MIKNINNLNKITKLELLTFNIKLTFKIDFNFFFYCK